MMKQQDDCLTDRQGGQPARPPIRSVAKEVRPNDPVQHRRLDPARRIDRPGWRRRPGQVAPVREHHQRRSDHPLRPVDGRGGGHPRARGQRDEAPDPAARSAPALQGRLRPMTHEIKGTFRWKRPDGQEIDTAFTVETDDPLTVPRAVEKETRRMIPWAEASKPPSTDDGYGKEPVNTMALGPLPRDVDDHQFVPFETVPERCNSPIGGGGYCGLQRDRHQRFVDEVWRCVIIETRGQGRMSHLWATFEVRSQQAGSVVLRTERIELAVAGFAHRQEATETGKFWIRLLPKTIVSEQ